MFFITKLENQGLFLEAFFFLKSSLFSQGAKWKQLNSNVEAVNTHRDKPTVSIFPWMTCRFPPPES